MRIVFVWPIPMTLQDDFHGNINLNDTSEDEHTDTAPSVFISERGFSLRPYQHDPLASSSPEANDEGPDQRPPAWRVGNANRCSCSNSCRPMPTEDESVCCFEIEEMGQLCNDQGVLCVTKHPLLELYCSNKDILDLAYVKLSYFCPRDAGNRAAEEYRPNTGGEEAPRNARQAAKGKAAGAGGQVIVVGSSNVARRREGIRSKVKDDERVKVGKGFFGSLRSPGEERDPDLELE
ncbi:hypothetical protein HPB47_019360, partial [Ixodes persulcatus]